jgi:RNA polymerase sigma-70 factor (ECF subfamily)
MLESTPGDSRTHATLLERLARPGTPDQTAWREFVQGYGPRIYRWCLRWRLQEADAQDVTQAVLLKLAGRMRGFVYDPARSFRAWLKTVAHNAWKDLVEDRRRHGQGRGGGLALEALDTAEARADLARDLEEQFDHEVLEKAMAVVRAQAAPHNWQAFALTALEGVDPAEAARRLGLNIARVYAARNRIQKRLQEACRKLEGGDASAADQTPEDPGA